MATAAILFYFFKEAKNYLGVSARRNFLAVSARGHRPMLRAHAKFLVVTFNILYIFTQLDKRKIDYAMLKSYMYRGLVLLSYVTGI